jgi:hypothetical protein
MVLLLVRWSTPIAVAGISLAARFSRGPIRIGLAVLGFVFLPMLAFAMPVAAGVALAA